MIYLVLAFSLGLATTGLCLALTGNPVGLIMLLLALVIIRAVEG